MCKVSGSWVTYIYKATWLKIHQFSDDLSHVMHAHSVPFTVCPRDRFVGEVPHCFQQNSAPVAP